MSIPSDSPLKFNIIETMDGDEDGLVLVTVKCVLAPQETRIIYVAFQANHDVPDAAENKVSMWDFDNNEDRGAYRDAMAEFAQVHILPLLSAAPRDTLFRPAGGVATFTLSTVGGSVQLDPGMPKSMKDVETRWLQSLPLIDTVSDHTPAGVVYDIDDVVVVDLLNGGSRDAMLVTLRDQPSTQYVTFWTPAITVCVLPSDYDWHAKAILHEMAFLRTIPPHPNIISPPVGYISRVHDGKRAICGYLVKYYTGGSLDSPERASAPLVARIKWAYQIASGLSHLHHVAHTYHGDIKLDNVVLDENGDAILIDFEQGRMNEPNAAPELRAASLVTSVRDDGRLCYSTPHPRVDSADHGDGDEDEDEADLRLILRDRPYDIWKDIPRAIEAAEVWAFATALLPLLSDVDAASAILARCRSEDPNLRPTFGELEEFFLDLYQRQGLP